MIDDGRFHIYSATVKERAGRWTVSLTGVASELHPAERCRSSRHLVPVGVDSGVTSICVAADANGRPLENFEGVKNLIEAQQKLKAANQALARTKPGSKGRQRARIRLNKIHHKVANNRRYVIHQATKTLVNKYQVLVIEDLDVTGMMKHRHLARSIGNSAMGEFARQVRYKAKWHDVEVRVADRFFPSSKTCSGCSNIKSELDLSTRTYSCHACGLAIDRDFNAAINLARWRPKILIPNASLTPTPAPLLSTY
jgi:putative transposase